MVGGVAVVVVVAVLVEVLVGVGGGGGVPFCRAAEEAARGGAAAGGLDLDAVAFVVVVSGGATLRFGGGATFTLWLALRARGRAIVVIASRDGDAAAADDGDASEAEDAPGESAAASKMSAKALGRSVLRAAMPTAHPAAALQQARCNTDSRARGGTYDR